MVRRPKPTHCSLEIVQALKSTLADQRGYDIRTVSHRVPIRAPGPRAPLIYTFDVACEPEGTYLATCAEVRHVRVVADPEEKAVLLARVAVFCFLHGRAPPKPQT